MKFQNEPVIKIRFCEICHKEFQAIYALICKTCRHDMTDEGGNKWWDWWSGKAKKDALLQLPVVDNSA